MKQVEKTGVPQVTVTAVQPWSVDEWSGCTATFTLDKELDSDPR